MGEVGEIKLSAFLSCNSESEPLPPPEAETQESAGKRKLFSLGG